MVKKERPSFYVKGIAAIENIKRKEVWSCVKASSKIKMKKESGKSIYLNYIVHTGLAMLSIIMLVDVAMICGSEKIIIPVYGLVEYVPQAIIMVIAPFACYTTYFEPIPKRWKLKKYIIIGILFTISMVMTIDLSIPILTNLYGSVDLKILLYPIIFYSSLGFDLLKVYLGENKIQHNEI